MKIYFRFARKFVKNEPEDFIDCGDNLVCKSVPEHEILFARWRFLLMYVNAWSKRVGRKIWDQRTKEKENVRKIFGRTRFGWRMGKRG